MFEASDWTTPSAALGPPRRWMLFVDGENLTMRAQSLHTSNSVLLTTGEGHQRFYEKDIFIWLPGPRATAEMVNLTEPPLQVQVYATRAFYYTSVVGDEDRMNEIRLRLKALGFTPEVFKKAKQAQKSKGVDIALAKDFLSNAFLDNYDVAVLIAGDGDYVPLINEVKRLGKVVYVIFFSEPGSGLSPALQLAADRFFSLDRHFWKQWRTLPCASNER